MVPETIPLIGERERGAIKSNYMPAPDHKALAISPYRAGFTSGQKDDETAKAGAMDSCQRALETINSKARCELYAIGNTVVYAHGRPPTPPEPWIIRDPAVERPFSTKELPLIKRRGQGECRQ